MKLKKALFESSRFLNNGCLLIFYLLRYQIHTIFPLGLFCVKNVRPEESNHF